MLSSRGYFRLRDRTHVSCISCFAGGFFTIEPPGKTPSSWMGSQIHKGQPFPGPGEMVLCSCEEHGSLELEERDSDLTPASV